LPETVGRRPERLLGRSTQIVAGELELTSRAAGKVLKLRIETLTNAPRALHEPVAGPRHLLVRLLNSRLDLSPQRVARIGDWILPPADDPRRRRDATRVRRGRQAVPVIGRTGRGIAARRAVAEWIDVVAVRRRRTLSTGNFHQPYGNQRIRRHG
jgi:hypothetical protein